MICILGTNATISSITTTTIATTYSTPGKKCSLNHLRDFFCICVFLIYQTYQTLTNANTNSTNNNNATNNNGGQRHDDDDGDDDDDDDESDGEE